MSLDFESQVLPHLDAAYRLAFWLTRHDSTAEDIVQDSYLRAFQAWPRFQAGNVKAWLLTIVRRQSFTWLRQDRGRRFVDIDDDAAFSPGDKTTLSYDQAQEEGLIAHQSAGRVRDAIAALPPGYRDVIVLKEFEDMPYKDIAIVLNIPIGTVMSRLARARDALKLEILKLDMRRDDHAR